MKLELSEEQKFVQQTARDFLTKNAVFSDVVIVGARARSFNPRSSTPSSTNLPAWCALLDLGTSTPGRRNASSGRWKPQT